MLSIFNLNGETAQSGRSHCSIQAEPLLNFAGRADFAERCTQLLRQSCAGWFDGYLYTVFQLCACHSLTSNMTVTERFATFRYYCLMPVHARGGLTVTKKRTEKRTPPAGNAPAGGKIYLPALSTPNSRLGQTEKSQNSSSENVAKTQIYQRFAGSR